MVIEYGCRGWGIFIDILIIHMFSYEGELDGASLDRFHVICNTLCIFSDEIKTVIHLKKMASTLTMG